jgi:hypothetical protein
MEIKHQKDQAKEVVRNGRIQLAWHHIQEK